VCCLLTLQFTCTWYSLYPDPIAPHASIMAVNLNVRSLTWRIIRCIIGFADHGPVRDFTGAWLC